MTPSHSAVTPSPPLSTVYRLPSTVCWLFILTFALFFSSLALQQHHAFQTNGLDLGNVDQALWNTAQGQFLQFSLMTPIENRLALHVEPILLLFVPFYWVGLGGPELLLIAQATVVALGAWPVYQLAMVNGQWSTVNGQRSIVNEENSITNYQLPPSFNPWLALTFPLIYLLLPTLQSAVLFDFHAITLAPTFFLLAYVALVQGKTARFFIYIGLAMACKEDMPLVAAMVGLVAGLKFRRWRLAAGTIGVSAVWFVVAVMIIPPYFAPGGNIQLDRYAWLGDFPVGMIQTVVTQPGLVVEHLWHQADLPGYLAWLFFPVTFLALFSPVTLLPMAPILAVNLLSDNPFQWRLEDFHYGAPLAPFLMISTIDGVRRILRWVERNNGQWSTVNGQRSMKSPSISQSPNLLISQLLFCTLLLTFSLIYHYQRGFSPLARPFSWPEVTAHHRQLAEVLATVPPEAAVFTPSNLAPHLSQRQTIYTEFAYFTDPDFPAQTPVEAVILEVTGFENIGGLHQFLRERLLESGDYELVTALSGILYLKPTAEPVSAVRLPPPFFDFARPTAPAKYNLRVDFGDRFRLHGYTLHFNRQEEIEVSLDLEPLRPLAGEQPVLYLLDETGTPLGATTDLQPGLVWYPAARWPVGERVRLRFNTLPWHTRTTARYRLAVGVIEGDDPWDVGRRLLAQIVESPFATRLPAEGTLVELARIEQQWQMPTGGAVARLESAPVLPHRLEVDFGDQVRLLGHSDIQLTTTRPDELSVTLAWQALRGPEPLVRFVQVIGPDGQVYGQRDSAPDRGQYPTQVWQRGEVVIDPVVFPLNPTRPDGDYTLHIGLYRPETGQRLILASGADHLEIRPE